MKPPPSRPHFYLVHHSVGPDVLQAYLQAATQECLLGPGHLQTALQPGRARGQPTPQCCPHAGARANLPGTLPHPWGTSRGITGPSIPAWNSASSPCLLKVTGAWPFNNLFLEQPRGPAKGRCSWHMHTAPNYPDQAHRGPHSWAGSGILLEMCSNSAHLESDTF